MQIAEYVGAPTGALAVPLRARYGGVRAWVLVDEADYPWVCCFNWALGAHGYAIRNVSLLSTPEGKCRMATMHRELLGLQPGDPEVVDHINRNKLDNRRCNLRIVTRAENAHNQGPNGANKSSQYRGVSRRKGSSKWTAQCRVKGRLHWLGSYDDELKAAAVARDFRRRHLSHATD